jgi:hypothetical protein
MAKQYPRLQERGQRMQPGQTASQALGLPADPTNAHMPLKTSYNPNSEPAVLRRIASAPKGTFTPSEDSVHQAAVDPWANINHSASTLRKVPAYKERVKQNTAVAAVGATSTGSMLPGQAIDLMQQTGTISDSLAKETKKSLAPRKTTVR